MSHPEEDTVDKEVSFFKGITEDTLVKAIFRGGLVTPPLVAQPPLTLGSSKPDHVPPHQWKVAAQMVIAILEAFNLEVANPSSRAWFADEFGSIGQTQFYLNRTIKFCCEKCKKNKVYSPIAVATCVEQAGVCSLQIQKVFFHDKDCNVPPNERKPPPDYCVVPYDYDEFIGDTYDGVVDRLKLCNFHDEDIPNPPGKHIDFGHQNYNYDDRAYEYLPSQNYPEVDKEKHREAMVRFFYFLASWLNIAEEAGSMVFDLESAKQHYIASSNKLVGLPPSMKNKAAHLYLNEISLLFGGHCKMRNQEEDPIHQICHMDGQTIFGELERNKELKGKQMPGSFIIPLEDYRSIYVVTPQTLVTVKRGQFLWFHGALPHGGITYKASKEGRDWHPAIHGHLDSIFHERKSGDLSFSNSAHVYFPKEHLELKDDLGVPLLDVHKQLGLIMEKIWERSSRGDRRSCKAYVKTLTQEQLECYNSVLCAPYQENKTIGLDYDMQVKQMENIGNRLNELLNQKHIGKANKQTRSGNNLAKLVGQIKDGTYFESKKRPRQNNK
jgi:hypothetical protein